MSENAGCTKGALYDHFGAKAGLFLALLDDQFATRLQQAQDAPQGAPSRAMPFDREFSLLFLEFVCASARDPKLRRRLASHLSALRSRAAERVGSEELAAAIGAGASGASIEALIYGEPAGTAAFDRILTALLGR